MQGNGYIWDIMVRECIIKRSNKNKNKSHIKTYRRTSCSRQGQQWIQGSRFCYVLTLSLLMDNLIFIISKPKRWLNVDHFKKYAQKPRHVL